MPNVSQSENRCSVLIVGAGPVGLLLANLLGVQNIPCLVIEKRTEDVDWSRAIGITPPSLDIFRQAGLAQAALNHGVKVEQAVVCDDRGRAGEILFSGIPSDFPFILTLPQAMTIKIMEQSLQRYACVTLRRGLELHDLVQSGINETVALVRDVQTGGHTKIAAQWIIGCDGAESMVRSLARIPFKRGLYAPAFVMSDYEDNSEFGDQARLFFTRRGSLESFPLPQRQRRWIAQHDGNQKETFHQEFLERRIADIGGVPPPGQPVSPVFEFVPRKIIVKKLTQGRIILAGDAGHVISPIGGQGMNTGFADVELLAAIMPRLLAEPEISKQLLVAYSRHRLRAAGIARRRAALGMWLGTWHGAPASRLRGWLLRSLLLRAPLSGKLPPYFAMLTIPRNPETLSCRNST